MEENMDVYQQDDYGGYDLDSFVLRRADPDDCD